MHKKEDWCTVRATKQLHKCKKQVNEENDNTQGNLHFLQHFLAVYTVFFLHFLNFMSKEYRHVQLV